MLVSSIGYFDVTNNKYVDNSAKNQAVKASLSEGFGHVNEAEKSSNNNSNFITAVIKSFQSLFAKKESDESSKYLSLIA